MSKLRSLAMVLAIAPSLAGCIGDGDVALDTHEPETSTEEQFLYGMEGTFEFALDAPWRLDPWRENGALVYPPIPIQVSFFDEYLADRDTTGRRLGDFCSLVVKELVNGVETLVGSYSWSRVSDSERLGMTASNGGIANWPYPDEGVGVVLPTRTVCQPDQGQACKLGRHIFESSEWNARVDVPLAKAPGTKAILKLEARVSKDVDHCNTQTYPDLDERISFVNWVAVEYGRAPLPTFSGDDRWLYSDLHYHSQGTDNEGEVGYNYRGTLAALSAMGLDVVFATDHASHGEQIIDADLGYPYETLSGARDMSPRRFTTARDQWLEGAGGVNPGATTIWPYHPGAPGRIFLGGEVDVAPVVDQRPTTGHDWQMVNGQPTTVQTPEAAWYIPHGNPYYDFPRGLRYDMHDKLCDGWLGGSLISCPGSGNGDVNDMFTPVVRDDGTTGYAVHDVQGFDNADYLGRQHILYLPRSKTTPDAFVGSRTSKYGGATRLFTDGPEAVADEILDKNGVGFLAHPLDGSGGGKGPGMVPYTYTQLAEAFEHRAIIGLQLWNENVRLEAGPHDCNSWSTPAEWQLCLQNDWKATGYESLTEGTQFNELGHQEGWDAGRFELVPVVDKETWTWKQPHNDLEFKLHHGGYTWDRLLRMGLERSRTSEIPWLAPGDVRKMFMAGGSDAHGDFNYRRNGYMVEIGNTNTDAFGSVRNLVLAGPGDGTAPTQDQFVDALTKGHFSVTDGPAVRIAIDRNGNGVYDDDDLLMGDTVYLDESEIDSLPLVVDWESTTDFGPIARVDLYVGVANDETEPSVEGSPVRTYAPIDHGVRRESTELTPGQVAEGIVGDPVANDCGEGICRMQDGYYLPARADRGQLRIVPDGDAMSGLRAITLDLRDFPTDRGAATRVYVRAFAETSPSPAIGLGCFLPTGSPGYQSAVLRGECIHRYAYTNPVWALMRSFEGEDCPLEPNSLDADLDGYPNACDGDPNVQDRGGWSRQIGGLDSDYVYTVAHDSTGAVISGGRFMSTVDIDGAPSLTVAGTNDRDGYVVKYDADGHRRWTVHLTGIGYAQVNDVAIEPGTDNVFATGTFTGQLLVSGWTTLTALAEDSFIMKINGETGAVMWNRALSGAGNQTASSVAFDTMNRVVVGGTFRNEVKFLPSLTRLIGDATDDCMVAFFSTGTGTFMNARKLSGSGACKGNDVATGPNERVYLVGEFTGALITDPVTNLGHTHISDGGTDGFVVAFDGYDFAWDHYLGGSLGAGHDAWVTAAAVNAAGEVVLGGHFEGYLFQDGTLLAYSSGQQDLFVARYGANGSRARIKQFGGTANDKMYDLDVSAAGVAITGLFVSPSINFGSTTLTRTGAHEGFAAILTTGDLQSQWADDFAFQGDSIVNAADVSDDGHLALGGQFGYWYKVDQTHQMLTRGVWDGFVARIQPLP